MKKLLKLLSWLFAAGSIVLVAVALYIYAVMAPSLPPIDSLEDARYQVPLRIYDKYDVLLAEFGEHRRIPVEFDKIPRHLIDAVVSVEDDQFWNHAGIDFQALLAAAWEILTTGRKSRGGSTITMQVARNFFLSPEQTYTRKFNEILLALRIEREFSKEKIIELYLNKIFLGHRAYGISAASQVYYDKALGDLTLAQAAMIAGLPKAPSKYNPISNPERALIRRNYILARMKILGYIDEQQLTDALNEPITAELHNTRTLTDAKYVAEMVRAQLYQQYGDEIYNSGMRVYTTIDSRMQTAANAAVRRALLDYDRRHGYRGPVDNIDLSSINEDPFDLELVTDDRVGELRKGVVIAIDEVVPETGGENADETAAGPGATVLISTYQQVRVPFEGGIDWAAPFVDEDNRGPEPTMVGDVLSVGDVIWLEQRGEQWWLADVPRIEGALVSLDPTDGGIQALVGGFDYFRNKFNRATQARRQPGSNFKPFIYSAALENGFTAASIINDAPVVFDDDSLEATWRPENYSGKFYGPTRLREALVKSRNLVSIRILRSIGLRTATEYVQRFGFEREQMPYDLSLALGSASFSPLQMARAYAVFANGGYLIEPYLITRVESVDGETIVEHRPMVICPGCSAPDATAAAAEGESDGGATAADDVLPAAGDLQEAAEESLHIVASDQPRYAPRVIPAQNAFIMRSIMREVVQRGTAVRAKVLGRADLAGKTGTTNDQIDAWFSGFNDQVVTTAWTGFDNQRKMGRRETGSTAALPMWIDFMRVALDGRPETLHEQPEGLVTVRIDAASGERADVDSRNSLFEVFRVENAPRELVVKTSSDPGDDFTINAPDTEEEVFEEIF